MPSSSGAGTEPPVTERSLLGRRDDLMDAAEAGHCEGRTADDKLLPTASQRGRDAGVRDEESQWRMMRSMGPALVVVVGGTRAS